VLQQHLGPDEVGIFLGTAHAAKFLEVLEPLALRPELPESLRRLLSLPLNLETLPAEVAPLKARLREVWSKA
jgi:threonine synthase